MNGFAVIGWLLLSAVAAGGQAVAPDAASSGDTKPLPDINTLMRQVEANERKSETVEKDYIFHRSFKEEELDGKGKVKRTDTAEAEVFWLNGVRVARLLKRDGKDLTADEKKKEDERIDKRVAESKARRAKADAAGKETDSHGNQEMSFARVLELGSFSNERREAVNGRDCIVVDYTGNPKVKTHSSFEGAFKELGGTVWVDERDQTIQHVEGRFINDFKLAGGLLVDIRKGTWFKASFVKINDEVWLPEAYEGHGGARFMLVFNINGSQSGRNSDYRKFKATSTVLPGFTTVDPEKPVVPPPPR